MLPSCSQSQQLNTTKRFDIIVLASLLIMSANHLTLGAAADERKARLAQLKTLKRKNLDSEISTSETADSDSVEESNVSKLHLSGRNYDPEVKGPKLGFETRPDLIAQNTLEKQAREVEQQIRKQNEEEQEDHSVDLFKLQPKKPNWDLKRDLDEKLEILSVRTENAIARLVRDRIGGDETQIKANNGGNLQKSDPSQTTGLSGAELVEGLKLLENGNANTR